MKNTYSFEGQDMISSSILRQIKKGTYMILALIILLKIMIHIIFIKMVGKG